MVSFAALSVVREVVQKAKVVLNYVWVSVDIPAARIRRNSK